MSAYVNKATALGNIFHKWLYLQQSCASPEVHYTNLLLFPVAYTNRMLRTSFGTQLPLLLEVLAYYLWKLVTFSRKRSSRSCAIRTLAKLMRKPKTRDSICTLPCTLTSLSRAFFISPHWSLSTSARLSSNPLQDMSAACEVVRTASGRVVRGKSRISRFWIDRGHPHWLTCF